MYMVLHKINYNYNKTIIFSFTNNKAIKYLN